MESLANQYAEAQLPYQGTRQPHDMHQGGSYSLPIRKAHTSEGGSRPNKLRNGGNSYKARQAAGALESQYSTTENASKQREAGLEPTSLAYSNRVFKQFNGFQSEFLKKPK